MTADASYFDKWYADMSRSTRRDEAASRALCLPPELESTSLLSWDGIGDVTAVLGLTAGQTVVDLACGRGGYGLEIAFRTGASLVGVDFSTVAIERAIERAGELGDRKAEFRVGLLTATGLHDRCAAAVLCIDAMQFAKPYAAGIAECRRILEPGGRLVLTGWQSIDPRDEAVPVRLRRDLGAALRSGGFADVQVLDMPAWRVAERAYWTQSVAADPDGDPAVQSLRDEGERTLQWLDRTRRVLVTGRAPADS
jgi:ubiquinone/menaquinone biosynthesis C-methylase UbiE